MSLTQLELTLDAPPASPDGRLPDFSRENLCIAWVTESDGHAWADWWRAQPEHARNGMLADYDSEATYAEIHQRPLRTYAYVRREHERVYQEERRIAEHWAADIRKAAIDRKPMPFHPPEHATLLQTMRFRSLLAMACDIAGVVIVESGPLPEEPTRRRARRRPPATALPGEAVLA